MKQVLLKTWLILACLLVGVGTTWGETRKVTIIPNSGSDSGTDANRTVYINGNSETVVKNASGDDILTWSTIKNSGSGIAYYSAGHWRLYYNSTKGTSIKLNCATGVKITEVVLTGVQDYTTTTKYYIDGGTANTGSWSSLKMTVSNINATSSFEFANCNSSNKQLRISQIEVSYDVTGGSTPATPYTITFNAGSNGSCSISSLTEASAGAGVTLPSCTPNSGYVFKGWSTSSTPTSADAGAAGANYKPSSDCNLYAYYIPTYTLTVTQPAEGGTLTVSDAKGTLVSGAQVEVGTNLTCEVTNIPAGKRFSRFYVNYDGGLSKYKATNPATFDNIPTEGITAAEVTVTYQDIQYYTINYMINGVNTNPQENVEEQTALVFPAVSDINGKTFVGWVEDAIDGTTDEEPSYVSTAGLKATANKTYYAVFADRDGGSDDGSTAVVEPETIIAYWAPQSLTASTGVSATTGSGTMTSSIAMTSKGVYSYYNGSVNKPEIILSNLNMSAYEGKEIALHFAARSSAQAAITVSTSDDGTYYTELTTTAATTKTEVEYVVENIPASAQYIKIVYNGVSGSFYFGSVKIAVASETNYEFEKLTESNTSGWSGSDWDGYYVIASGTNALCTGLIGDKNFITINPENDVVTLSDHNAIFQVTYDEEKGYAVQGLGYGFYLGYASNSVSCNNNAYYMSSIGYNSMNCSSSGSNYHLQFNSTKFGFYSSNYTAPTFYKILAAPATYSNYTTFVGYTRDDTNGNLGTICVPCAVPAEGIHGATFYSIAGKRVDGEGLPTSVVFEEVEELEAGVPYIFLAEADAITLSYTGDAVATAGNAGGLYGTFENIDFANDMDDYNAHPYYIINKTKIQKASSKSGVDANRAFIKMDEVPLYNGGASNRMLVVGQNGFEFEDGTITSIDAVETANPSVIYDLQGRRVMNAKNGMYIVNGRKVIR